MHHNEEEKKLKTEEHKLWKLDFLLKLILTVVFP